MSGSEPERSGRNQGCHSAALLPCASHVCSCHCDPSTSVVIFTAVMVRGKVPLEKNQ